MSGNVTEPDRSICNTLLRGSRALNPSPCMLLMLGMLSETSIAHTDPHCWLMPTYLGISMLQNGVMREGHTVGTGDPKGMGPSQMVAAAPRTLVLEAVGSGAGGSGALEAQGEHVGRAADDLAP